MYLKSGRTLRTRAFTLVELMTVVGIIGILIAFMLPALVGARKAAQTTQCASNMRQIAQAMINYSVEFRGKFPPNWGEPVYTFWYDKQTTGRYIKQAAVAPAGAVNKNEQLINGVFLCPADLMEPTPAVRSYAMNIWASGAVSAGVQQRAQGPEAWGRLWSSGVGNSSQMMLLLESFSALAIPEDLPDPVGFAPPAVVGFPPPPGARFVGAGGWAGYVNADETRFGTTESHIAYFRHRRSKDTSAGLGNAIGRLNIAFADGHVSLHSDKDLYDPATGRSTYVAMWSPIDREVDEAFGQPPQ